MSKSESVFAKWSFTRVVLCVGLATLIWTVPGAAQSKSVAAEDKDAPARNYFTDVQLVNQDGKPMRFYSDLLKDKVVIINTFFTTCNSVCPPMTRNLERVQNWLGDRLGKDVYIISISVDPAMDTPPRLKDYAQKYKAKPGWFFLTGTKENAQFALRKIGQYVETRDDHSTVIIIGNLHTGLWKKAMGMAKPDDLIKVVESVVDDKPGDVK
ncbi:MAG TPA: SCO family protein [Blastocatellia bacterium]|nr:SCO family protein [Blastocatellia bacterium]